MTSQAEKEDKDKSYYLKEPYVYLLNPSLLKNEISLLYTFQVNKILPEFVKVMKENNEFIDFKVLGNATFNAVKIHKNKIDIVIKHQLRLNIKSDKKKAEQQFNISQQLPYWYTRPRLTLASSLQKWTFYEELLITFQELEQSLDTQDQKRKLKPSKESDDPEKPIRRRKKLTADALSHFDYLMNFDLTDVDQLVNSIWVQIHKLATLIGIPDSKTESNNEIMFDVLFVERLRIISETELEFNQEKIQLEKVRTLMSLLYLIQEGKIEAWQDEDSLEIGIKLLKLPEEI